MQQILETQKELEEKPKDRQRVEIVSVKDAKPFLRIHMHKNK